jgi:hypothetical protein
LAALGASDFNINNLRCSLEGSPNKRQFNASPKMATTDPLHVSTTSLFSSLLEQSRKLRQEIDTADLPPIQLGLGEIERRAKELKKSTSGRQTDARAYV